MQKPQSQKDWVLDLSEPLTYCVTFGKYLAFLGLYMHSSQKIFGWTLSWDHYDSHHLGLQLRSGQLLGYYSSLEEGCSIFSCHLESCAVADKLVVLFDLGYGMSELIPGIRPVAFKTPNIIGKNICEASVLEIQGGTQELVTSLLVHVRQCIDCVQAGYRGSAQTGKEPVNAMGTNTTIYFTSLSELMPAKAQNSVQHISTQ